MNTSHIACATCSNSREHNIANNTRVVTYTLLQHNSTLSGHTCSDGVVGDVLLGGNYSRFGPVVSSSWGTSPATILSNSFPWLRIHSLNASSVGISMDEHSRIISSLFIRRKQATRASTSRSIASSKKSRALLRRLAASFSLLNWYSEIEFAEHSSRNASGISLIKRNPFLAWLHKSLGILRCVVKGTCKGSSCLFYLAQRYSCGFSEIHYS